MPLLNKELKAKGIMRTRCEIKSFVDGVAPAVAHVIEIGGVVVTVDPNTPAANRSDPVVMDLA